MLLLRWGVVSSLIVFLAGCLTASSPRSSDKAEQEAMIKAVAGSLKGKPLSEEEFEQLKKDVSRKGEAQEAVQAITGSVSGASQVIKYCPVDGERYAPHMAICPEHHVPLEELKP